MHFPTLRKVMPFVAAALLLILTSDLARAEPIKFSNVQAVPYPGTSPVLDLFENQGTTLTLPPNSLQTIVFIVQLDVVPAGVTDTLQATLTSPGQPTIVQEFAVSESDPDLEPPFLTLFSHVFPASYKPRPYDFKVDLLKSAPDFQIPSGPQAGQLVDSFSYEFSVVTPVPEPASIVLLGSGIVCVLLRCRRNRTDTR